MSIARALANDPPVLLADEPTANLDSSHGHDIGRLLRRLATEDGRSVVIVSHDERLKEIADRVLWLEDGTFRGTRRHGDRPDLRHGRHRRPTTPRTSTETDKPWWFCSTTCRDEYAADRPPPG